MFVIMIGSAVALSSCGDDDDENIGGSGSSSGSGKITVALATNKVQTIKLHKVKVSGWHSPDYYLDQGEQVIFYKDYKYKYGLCLFGNNLTVVPYALNSSGDMMYDSAVNNGAVAGMIDNGKISGINEINNFYFRSDGTYTQGDYYLGNEGYCKYNYYFENDGEIVLYNYKYYEGQTLSPLQSCKLGIAHVIYTSYDYYSLTALPNHGYAIAFNTYEDGVKFMRVYEKSYTQQNDGEVTDITVEYQLFDPVVPKE